jgi:hypothetical protein
MTKAKTKTKPDRMRGLSCVLGSRTYGLYFGLIESYDPATQVAVVRDCRHIYEWHGRAGGITSLASHGICGPDAGKSRIGRPAPVATLTEIINVFGCTATAAESIMRSGDTHA